MKVTITTPFARLAVEMTASDAQEMMLAALKMSEPEPTKTKDEPPKERKIVGTPPVVTLPYRPEKPTVSTLSVKKEDPKPAPAPTITPPVTPVAAPQSDFDFGDDMDTPVGFSAKEQTPEEGYSGFLHIKCSHCHKEKIFHSKNHLKEYHCECGHTMPLSGLSKGVSKCDCGWKMHFFTNHDADSFETKCVCGAPALVKWHFGRKRYVKES